MRTILAIAITAVLAVPVSAEECQITTTQPDVTYGNYYVDNDLCQVDAGCLFSIKTYEETNGIDGLQRRDDRVDDTCAGRIDGDTRITY